MMGPMMMGGGVLIMLLALLLIVGLPLLIVALVVRGRPPSKGGRPASPRRPARDCPACGRTVQPNWNVCPYCGKDLT